MSQKTFELLVFDWDGTLMDSEAHIVASMQRAVEDADLAPVTVDEVRNTIGLGLREAIVTLLPHESEKVYEAIIDRYRYHFFADDPCEAFDGAETVLSALRDQGYLLAVATGKGRPGLNRVLESTGFGQYFVESRTADETCSKPDPQMLNEIMKILDVSVEKTLMIGDTEYDLEMANAAGVAPLAVDYGVHERDRLLACGPLGCLASIRELPDWLEQHFKKPFSRMASN